MESPVTSGSYAPDRVEMIALRGLPMVQQGMDLAELIAAGLETGKDPAVVQLILVESVAVLRQGTQVIVVEHRFGFVMANAGIDQSNAAPGCAILPLLDPNASAARLAAALGERCGGRRIGVIIIDSFGRPWRNGTVGHAIGVSGRRALLDLRQSPDLMGRPMQVTEVALSDEIAAGAYALMGQGAEAKPVVIVRGFCGLRDNAATVRALSRHKDQDSFR